ncbi:MAG: bifunctional riboflavin kinase/FAD synthetase [Symbiobacteriia bacterium]
MNNPTTLGKAGKGGPGRAVAIGTFDGVHRGHRELFRRLALEARQRGLESVALTFDPHPLVVVRPDAAPPLLTETREKVALIQNLGVDRVVVLPFDQDRAGQSARDFVTEVLVGGLSARLVLEGWNFSFGRGREGTSELLTRMGSEDGFEVQVLPPVSLGDEVVSSTAIREHLSNGRVERAAALLGRPYTVVGRVVRGEQRGRTLGYPTANLDLTPGLLVPGHGVYAVDAQIGSTGELPDLSSATRCGMANIGRRPTFGGESDSVEVHLFDFQQDIYDQWLRLTFISKLRNERTFPNAGTLIHQLDQDAAAARHVLRQQVR